MNNLKSVINKETIFDKGYPIKCIGIFIKSILEIYSETYNLYPDGRCVRENSIITQQNLCNLTFTDYISFRDKTVNFIISASPQYINSKSIIYYNNGKYCFEKIFESDINFNDIGFDTHYKDEKLFIAILMDESKIINPIIFVDLKPIVYTSNNLFIDDIVKSKYCSLGKAIINKYEKISLTKDPKKFISDSLISLDIENPFQHI